MGLDHV
jgi:hypothetical protein